MTTPAKNKYLRIEHGSQARAGLPKFAFQVPKCGKCPANTRTNGESDLVAVKAPCTIAKLGPTSGILVALDNDR